MNNKFCELTHDELMLANGGYAVPAPVDDTEPLIPKPGEKPINPGFPGGSGGSMDWGGGVKGLWDAWIGFIGKNPYNPNLPSFP